MGKQVEVNPFFEVGAFIAALDPGKTTGVCLGVVRPAHTWDDRIYFDVLQSAVIGWDERFLALHAILSLYRPHIIVVEEFRLRENAAKGQVGSTFPSVEVIGAIRAFAFTCGLLNRVVMQEPVSMSSVSILPAHEEHLLKNNTAAIREHAKDAYKHLRYYVVQQINRSRS